MSENTKKYELYNSVDIENEDISDYPKDSFVTGENKKVGKLDSYSKDKENYDKQKAKVLFETSKDTPDEQESKLDDLIPANIGGAIDNVFSKVDGLLNATGKFFFGGKKASPKPVQKAPAPKPVVQPKPVEKKVVEQPKPIVQQAVQQPVVQTTVKEVVQPVVQKKVEPVKQDSGGLFASKLAAKKNKTVAKASSDEDFDEVDNSPLVTRTTYISEIDLPLELLNDPDLVKYFDQMKLYDKKVTGGLCSRTYNQTSKILKKGRWGKMFTITYNHIKVSNLMSSAEAGVQRFNGMLPVYKACAKNFPDTEALRRAIENDVNTYLRTGDGSPDFHKFTYKVK
ncbi:MAG: hypothetical protein U0457_07120 [Candidatus Sericytochromatia bacterium]